MDIKLLKDLKVSSLPISFDDRTTVEQVRVLVATGMVAAMMSSPGSRKPFARVLAITKDGHALLVLSDAAIARRAKKLAPE